MADKSESNPEPKLEDKREEVRTGADRLLELVKVSKEVAMAEAANRLGVSVQTVEAWANFLEEDGLITVKYKFTTPYIAVPEGPKAKTRGAPLGLFAKKPAEGEEAGEGALSELRAELASAQDLLQKAAEERAAGEFGLLRQTYAELLSKLKLMHDRLAAQAQVAPQRRVAAGEALKELESAFQSAVDYAAKGEFDKASFGYSELYGQAQKLIQDTNQLYEQITALQAIQETKDYHDLLGSAYQMMSEGKVEGAKQVYEKLRFAHENLAKEFVEKKRQMEEDLVKLNKDMAKRVDLLNIQKLKGLAGRINALLTAGNKFFKKGEFDTAEAYYVAIKREYESMPPGFAEEKRELQQKVLDFYSALARQKEKATRKKFEDSVRRIESLAKEMQDLVRESRAEDAIQLYRHVKLLFNSLPRGFLKDKATLQERILPLYTAIMSTYTQESLRKLKSRSAEIMTLLNIMDGHTERGELKESEEAYERIKQLYKELPKGFLHEETMLQNQIVQSYENFLRKSKEMEAGSFASTLSSISKLLGEAEGKLEKNDYDSANQAYLEIMEVYNTLPTGFTAQKTELRERVLRLYKTLLSVTSPQQSTDAAVDGILKIIMDAHNAVSAGNFQFLQGSIPWLDALAKKLPSLAKTNPKIAAKVADIKEEFELYKNAASLQPLFESGGLRGMKTALDFIKMRGNALKQRCPEDKTLFDYVSSQYDIYLSKLMSSAATAAGEGAEKQLWQPVQAEEPKAEETRLESASGNGFSAEIGSEGSSIESEIQKKIEELRKLGRATVKLPQ